MVEEISVFRSPEYKTRFIAAYDAVLKQWPVPYEEVYIPTQFGGTHVVVSGPHGAPPVVLLPPGGTYAPIWVRNVGPLSQVFRVFAVDIIGEMNKSKPIHPIRNHAEFMVWMRELLDDLHIEKTDIIGNSNGGFFSLEAALYLPERIKKVVLISPAATFVQMWGWWFHLLFPTLIASMVHSERMIQKAYAWLWQDFPIDEDSARLRLLSKVSGRRYRPTINKVVPRVFSDEELYKIKAPVLLLIGDHEVIYSPSAAFRRAARCMVDLKTEIVPNANHTAQYTAPDFINSKILEFLA